jgi:glycosyltransferase involved in cell wall biosynthesis
MNHNQHRPKTVLLIIPNLGRGGAQKVFRDQLAFYSTHFNTIGCVFNWDDSFDQDRSLNVISLGVPAGKNIFSKFYFFLKRVSALRAIKNKYKVTTAISHLEGADYVNVLSGNASQLFCWIHGTKKFDRNISGLIGLLRKKILMPLFYRRADLVITVSQGIRNELIMDLKLHPSRVTTILNGIDSRLIHSKSSEAIDPLFKHLSSLQPVAMVHCRLAVQKNLGAFLKIARELKKAMSIKFVVVGDGELRADLLDEAAKLNLRAYAAWEGMKWDEHYDVYFLGHQINPFKYLKNASVYLLPSLWEGFPLSLCEAMACGLPVIAADCYTGPRELLNSKSLESESVTLPEWTDYGILMPLPETDRTIELWSQTILKTLNDRRWIADQSLAVVQRAAEFDQEIVHKKWMEIIPS